jgi:hypothetical protein
MRSILFTNLACSFAAHQEKGYTILRAAVQHPEVAVLRLMVESEASADLNPENVTFVGFKIAAGGGLRFASSYIVHFSTLLAPSPNPCADIRADLDRQRSLVPAHGGSGAAAR